MGYEASRDFYDYVMMNTTTQRRLATLSRHLTTSHDDPSYKTSWASILPHSAPGRSLKFTDEEWRLRCKLACAYRVANSLGWDQVIFNHITARVPNSEHESDGPHFLINPLGLRFDEVTACSLLKVTTDQRLDDLYGGAQGHTSFIPALAGSSTAMVAYIAPSSKRTAQWTSDDWYADDHGSQWLPKTPKIAQKTGCLTDAHEVMQCKYGLIFGGTQFVGTVDGRQPKEGECAALWCHLRGSRAYDKWKWCHKDCADQTHNRPDGLTDDDLYFVNLDKPRMADDT